MAQRAVAARGGRHGDRGARRPVPGHARRRDGDLRPPARQGRRRADARRPSAHAHERRPRHLRSSRAILNPMVQYSTTDRAFSALADPTRRAVLERLVAGSATVSELAEPFGMSLTGMKKHVRLLEEAQLVTTAKIGRVRTCMLAPYAFE